jgi:hypothetical protein
VLRYSTVLVPRRINSTHGCLTLRARICRMSWSDGANVFKDIQSYLVGGINEVLSEDGCD